MGVALKSTDPAVEARKQVGARTHPARSLLDRAAMGHEPAAEEVAAVIMLADQPDRGRLRSRLAEVLPEIHEAHDAGAFGEARRLARELAFEVADVTGPIRRRDEDLSQLTPRELAERIRR